MKQILYTILVLVNLCACTQETTVCGRIYPERQDDLCWENEYVGFRAYGPATEAVGEKMYGYDLFLKRGTTRPIIPTLIATDHDPRSWAKVDSLRALSQDARADSLINTFSYHVDHGYGMDCYAVGPTLGAGTTAIIDSLGNIIYPGCYAQAEILENGPKRFTARLRFRPFVYAGDTISEERTITLLSGSNLNQATVTYHGLTRPVTIATGIVLHDDSPVSIDPGRRFMAYTDPTQGSDNGQLFIGATFPSPADSIAIADQSGIRHLLAYHTYRPGTPYTYSFGFGWSRGNIPTHDDWLEYLKQ